ncbi:MAG: PH domain-containing protein [Balneolaceae bacterium]|nr:PH domain-containing protein [Balneolaceae bacterium]
MKSEPQHRIPRTAVKAWRISGLLVSLFFWIGPIAMWFFDTEGVVDLWIYLLILSILIPITILSGFAIPHIRWKRWRYDINEHEIDLQHGLIIVQRTLIPVNRVQHVDTRQGPILRNYGLSNVTISTAATTHEIPALSEENAGEVRDQISRLALKAKEDV